MQDRLAGRHHLCVQHRCCLPSSCPFLLLLRVSSGYSWRCTDLCLRLVRTDYNEEWFPINDPTWKDKTGQPYGKVPANLDWISYDVRAASPLPEPTLCRLR